MTASSARPINTASITQRNADMVLGFMGHPVGLPPKEGTIPWFIIAAAVVADDFNRERLERGYEGLVSAVRLFHEGGKSGVEELVRLATGTGPF